MQIVGLFVTRSTREAQLLLSILNIIICMIIVKWYTIYAFIVGVGEMTERYIVLLTALTSLRLK